MEAPIAQPVSNVACIPFFAFDIFLFFSIVVFSFLDFINEYFITTKANMRRATGIKPPQVTSPHPVRAILIFLISKNEKQR